MTKPTRKSIGDINGNKSVYVIEVFNNNKWIPYWKNAGYREYANAEAARKEAYRECKWVDPSWTRNRFRVTLYVRKETSNNKTDLRDKQI